VLERLFSSLLEVFTFDDGEIQINMDNDTPMIMVNIAAPRTTLLVPAEVKTSILKLRGQRLGL